MDEIRIRAANASDLPHLLHHRRAMFEEMGTTDAAVLDGMEEATERYFRESLPAGTYRGWVAETGEGRVIGGGGVAIVHWPGSPDFRDTRRAWILNIYTEPKFRHRGVAKRVVQTIVEWCRGDGFAHVSLHASRFGRGLYEQLGFAPTNEMRLYLR
jgi:GNAT superfamily N-acetyltransferase